VIDLGGVRKNVCQNHPSTSPRPPAVEGAERARPRVIDLRKNGAKSLRIEQTRASLLRLPASHVLPNERLNGSGEAASLLPEGK